MCQRQADAWRDAAPPQPARDAAEAHRAMRDRISSAWKTPAPSPVRPGRPAPASANDARTASNAWSALQRRRAEAWRGGAQ
jgi:hypothetical protein